MKLVFDIETDGLAATKVWCIVAKEVTDRCVGKLHIFRPDRINEGIQFLQQADKLELIGHHILGFDVPVLERLYNTKFTNKLTDTLVLSRLANPVREGGHSLKDWGYHLKYNKLEQPLDFNVFSEEMLTYCIRDVELNEKIYHKVIEDLKSFGPESIELEHQVTTILQEQERRGFKLDQEKAMRLLIEFKTRMYEIEKEVTQTFKPRLVDDKLVVPQLKNDGCLSKVGLSKDEYQQLVNLNAGAVPKPFKRQKLQAFNLGSRKQIGEQLKELGWKPKKFTPTGQPIIDEGTLKKITHIKEAKLIADFLLYQKRIGQVSSWVDSLRGSRVHGGVICTGAITGRMAHFKPNLAQVPNSGSLFGKECRECWMVEEGYKLVGIDASGLELRMLAHYMNDEDYLNEVINGDIHTANQRLAKLESRDSAKTFIYALVYGAGDEKLGAVVNGTRKDGKALRNTFLTNLPSLKVLTEQVRRAASRGYLKGLDRRNIFIRSEHAALNTLLQGGGAIVMKKALCILHESIAREKLDAHFVANIHDEWQLEVAENHADQVGKLGVQAIEQAAIYFKLRCPLTGKYKIGDNWSETH
jgi:DNA polymerase I